MDSQEESQFCIHLYNSNNWRKTLYMWHIFNHIFNIMHCYHQRNRLNMDKEAKMFRFLLALQRKLNN